MADVHGQQGVPGIKLFGTTIALRTGRVEEDVVEEKGDRTADKRPEKVIPCPRCKSMETKFCYFNNYNVNQPRHFCKGCQRYWTAGGALRNVPVGAGRRKAKPPCRGFTESAGGVGGGGCCPFDASSGVVQQQQHDDLDGVVVDGWRVETTHGGYQHVFPVKRRRNEDPGTVKRFLFLLFWGGLIRIIISCGLLQIIIILVYEALKMKLPAN